MTHDQRRAVLVITDGQRRDMLGRGHSPRFDALGIRGTPFTNHRSVFPSVTRCCSASIATGCRPARHGIAGNTLALPDGEGGFVVRNAGQPEIFAELREAYGRVLKVPTMAEHLADAGGVVVLSNASPGAAFMHDPEAFGRIYHRSGSRGPGGTVLADEGLIGQATLPDDVALTRAFCDEILPQKAALSVLWLSHPDKVMHAVPLGSPAHMAAVATVDACLGRVVDTVDALRAVGEDILLLAGSDHGHQTVVETVDVEAGLVAAGLKDALDSSEAVLAPQGTSGHIYLAPHAMGRRDAIAAWLGAQDWCGEIVVGDRLGVFGHTDAHGLAILFSSADRPAPSSAAPGGSVSFHRHGENPAPVGFGQHGGLGAYEQAPVLIADGPAFAGGSCETATDITDIAPTILAHLGLPTDAMDGRPLQPLVEKRAAKGWALGPRPVPAAG